MSVVNISPPDHRIKSIGIGILDEYECSCGWKSNGYYDGFEYAIRDWQDHVQKETKVRPPWPYKNE